MPSTISFQVSNFKFLQRNVSSDQILVIDWKPSHSYVTPSKVQKLWKLRAVR